MLRNRGTVGLLRETRRSLTLFLGIFGVIGFLQGATTLIHPAEPLDLLLGGLYAGFGIAFVYGAFSLRSGFKRGRFIERVLWAGVAVRAISVVFSVTSGDKSGAAMLLVSIAFYLYLIANVRRLVREDENAANPALSPQS